MFIEIRRILIMKSRAIKNLLILIMSLLFGFTQSADSIINSDVTYSQFEDNNTVAKKGGGKKGGKKGGNKGNKGNKKSNKRNQKTNKIKDKIQKNKDKVKKAAEERYRKWKIKKASENENSNPDSTSTTDLIIE